MASCGTLTVEAPFDRSNVVLGQCGQDFPLTLDAGSSQTVRTIVTNTNDVAAAVTVVLEANGQEIGRQSATISPGTNETVNVRITAPSTGGTFDVSGRLASIGPATAAATVPGLGVAEGVLGSLRESLEGDVAGVDRKTVAAGGAGVGTGLAALLLG